jgi:hypothetical protein
MPIRLYHPNLEPPNNECEVMDDAQVAVLAESGWLPAPEPPEAAGPHVAPEPVRYGPVSEPAAEPSRPTASAARSEWAEYVDYLGGKSDGRTIAELKAKADELEGEKADELEDEKADELEGESD